MHTKLARASLLTDFFQSLFGGFCIKGSDTKYRLNDYPTSLLLINHLKTHFGAFGSSKDESIGGDAGKFASTMRFFMERVGYCYESKQSDGSYTHARVKIHCEKNKLAEPFNSGEFLFNLKTCAFEEDYKFLLKESIENGLVEKSGSWFIYNDVKAQGEKGFKELCDKDADFYKKVIEGIKNKNIFEEEDANKNISDS